MQVWTNKEVPPGSRVRKFLEGTKLPSGAPAWSTIEPHEDRCNWALIFDGEVSSEIVITAYTTQIQPSFGLVLLYCGMAVWRIDYGLETVHTNGPVEGAASPSLIAGPHYHSWEDNEHLWTDGGNSKELKIAAPLPANVRGYDNCFRWFCSRVNVDISGQQVPALPPRRVLL